MSGGCSDIIYVQIYVHSQLLGRLLYTHAKTYLNSEMLESVGPGRSR